MAWRLEVAMRELGAETLAFDIIVGSGPNAALPHHRAGERVLKEGEPIVIDMGAKYNGYCSDLTRTIILGEPDERFITRVRHGSRGTADGDGHSSTGHDRR